MYTPKKHAMKILTSYKPLYTFGKKLSTIGKSCGATNMQKHAGTLVTVSGSTSLL